MKGISVIIPTRNRAAYLKQAVESVLYQDLPPDRCEILIVDNGSSDDTKAVVEDIVRAHGRRVAYTYESEPGLHNARHRGAHEAQGDILVYIDDDIIAAPGWLRAIHGAFSDRDAVLAGGKILPQWEGDVPEWLEVFRDKDAQGWRIGHLSLLDLGDHPRTIPATCVYGCNFAVRRAVLYECGGFHPDSMPEGLIKYRGDGETALSRAIEKKGYKAVYEPAACVYHRVPRERLTVEYFCRRAFHQGISDSFREIRRSHGMDGGLGDNDNKNGVLAFAYRNVFRFVDRLKTSPVQRAIRKKVAQAHEEGKAYLVRQTQDDPELLRHVLQESYF